MLKMRTKKTEIIEKLMQKIENHINLHKRTLIESHRIHRKKKIFIKYNVCELR